MKRLFILWTAFLFALCLAGSAPAQEKTKAVGQGEIQKPATEKSKPEEGKMKGPREISAIPSIWRMGGVVTAVNPKNKTLSVHQVSVYHDRTRQLAVSGEMAKELENLKPGNLGNVWVTGKTVTALKKVG